ncbi:MAG: hypothetical protein H8E16_03975 [Flavobacteriales bacterium]|nr:hypothetical protein [Flavobacteriales bacterium]
MSHHNNKPEFSAEQFFKDNARNRGLTTPKTPSRAQMIMDKDMQDRFNNYDSQPTQLGNASEDNTLASLFYGGPVIKKGFDIFKNRNIIQRIMKKGKDLALTPMGQFVTKHADDIFMINSLGNEKK